METRMSRRIPRGRQKKRLLGRYARPIYPKNLYLDRAPIKHEEYRREVLEKQIALMLERGVWKKSSYD